MKKGGERVLENNLEQRLQKYAKKQERKKVWKKILSVLSVMVVFCTTYALILPAITQERETFCQIEEHIHSESCFATEKTLLCETIEEEGHSHSEECYSKNLVCIEEENHTHSEECYLEEELVCGKVEQHLHSEECFENILTCEKEEKDGHFHSDECYVIENSECIILEHSHSIACYSDSSADVETEVQWTSAFAETEKADEVSENIIRIAKSQIGYHESVKNYIVSEDGETLFGRTRFGEWFGEPYAEWNKIFAAFCLNYAEAEIPFENDAQKWIEILSLPETDIYVDAKEHNPLPGDLVFISLEKNEKADAVGFVYEILENEIKIIAGDIENCVTVLTYPTDSAEIIGYGKIAVPSPYICGREEHLHEEKCFDFDGNLVCGSEEHSHSEACLEESEPEEALEYFCGFDEHAHGEDCFDENGELICEITEHAHSDECLTEKEALEYLCGLDEHAHSEECYDEQGNLVCEIAEHAHSEDCLNPYLLLTEEERARVETVISMIEELLTYEEIEEKIIEFEDAEDYEGEEAWLTELYQKVGYAYKYYSALPDEHKVYVTNVDKLLDLEFIWSMAVLIEIEVADAVEYSTNMFNSSRHYAIYIKGNNGYYAINATGGSVPVNVDSNGVITAGISSKNELLWSFTKSGNDYTIRNKASTNRYLYPSGSAITGTRSNRSTLVESSGGVKIKYGSEYVSFNPETGAFGVTKTEAEAAVFSFGIASTAGDIYIWFDGTWGDLDDLSGSDNTLYTVSAGGKLILPEEWKTPDGYSYVIRGWYDILGEKYYAPGAEIYPETSTVFYPDWVPASYNIGQFTAETSNTVSTSNFITTKVFDYSLFYNLPYIDATNVTVNASGHSESWKLNNKNDVIFRTYNANPVFECPENGQVSGSYNGYDQNNPTIEILSDSLVEKLFGTNNIFDPATGTGVMGKTYLGTGDHLFQYCEDPNNTEYYGYYYYDSLYNAAAYNQSAQRFYVYDYLVRADDGGTADFLALNSPYVNTNGRTVKTYSANGTTNYEFSGGSGVTSEYWFGIQTDIKFYLSGTPGKKDSEGNNPNQGINGEDLIFEFTGDDDVWVLVDGKLVLDIGGIHQAVTGSINFSTGEVVVNGSPGTSVKDLEPGDHILTMYYLERGAGDSNCKIKFNISTRYGLSLQKEDVLTRELLNGAEFTVYTNESCTNKAMLWKSHADYEAGAASQSTFVVEKGVAEMWGLSAGNTYYIKETKYPTSGGYGVANGIIVMKLNSKGQATFDVIPDPNGNGSDLSGGFTVHGYKIDVENHEAYLVATNSKEEYGGEVTSVTVFKEWKDNIDHSSDSVTAYILANGFRIQEAVLNEENNWTHTWKNLPINGDSGKPVKYTVEEGTVPGYFGTITELTEKEVETITLAWEKTGIQSGKTHLIKANNGYLAASGGKLSWISSEEVAKTSESARWVITTSGSGYIFKNEAGQTLYYYSNGGTRQFRASNSPGSNTTLNFKNNKLSYKSGNTTYYFSGISNSNGSTNSKENNGLSFTIYTEVEKKVTKTYEFDGKGFLIQNEPITVENSVSFRVNKAWDVGQFATKEDYEQLVIPFRLYENGADSGMTANLSLKNGWTYNFTDLPKFDSGGNEIDYTVVEEWSSGAWLPEYGEIIETSEGQFEVTVTNVCRLGYELPKTGGVGKLPNIIGGIFLLTAGSALIYKHIHQKRGKEDGS